jgi:hypothetical protein
MFAAPDAYLGNVKMSVDGAVACTDLTPLRERLGRTVYGLLGVDFFRNQVVALDFDLGHVRFLNSAATPDESWGERIPMALGAVGLPQVLVAFGGNLQVPFVLDSGDFGTISGRIDASLFARLAESRRLRIVGTCSSAGLRGLYRLPVGRVGALDVGSIRHEKLLFSEGNGNALGLNYLRRYRAIFDFPGAKLYLAKGKRFDERDRGSLSGLSLLYRPGNVLVEDVNERGAGYAAGVRTGDRLLEVGGVHAEALSMSVMARLLANNQGKPLSMILERCGTHVHVTIVPGEFND